MKSAHVIRENCKLEVQIKDTKQIILKNYCHEEITCKS